MRPADLAEIVTVTDPRLSPDGSTVAVVVTTADLDANASRSRVWLVAVDGSSPPQPFTRGGDARDVKPRWSPDGARLAFVTHRAGSGSEIVTLPVATGGEAVVVARWPEEVEELLWSPDGARLAFIARVADLATYGAGIDGDKDRPPRRQTRLVNRLDSVGWTMDRPSRVLVVGADGTTKPVEVTGLNPEGSDIGGVTWSPDGTRLAWCQGVVADWDVALDQPLVIAPIPGSPGRPTVIGAGRFLSRPSWSPDGSAIAAVTGDRANPPRHSQIALLDPASGPGTAPTILTEGLDRHCAPYLSGGSPPLWVGEHLWFQVEDAGSLHVYRVATRGAAPPERMIGGDLVVTGFDAAAAGTVVFTATTATSTGELFVLDVATGATRPLSRFGEPFCSAVAMGEPHRFSVKTKDGEAVDAWFLAPTGPDRHATLLNIHGGPFGQYTSAFFDEFALQAGAGYGVLWCNPRGSSGRSEAWGRAIRGPKCTTDPGSGWGGVDADDVLAVVDDAIVRFALDPERIGVLGGSYGGYLTSWLVGHTGRFAAACSERAVNNQLSMVWTSDIGTSFQRGYVGVSHIDEPEEYLRMSPISYVKEMHTPLLILHADGDLRCPVSQAEELWIALHLLGREVEFVRFPGSSHELSRSGPPRQRVARAELILEFFDRHLPAPANPA